MESKVPRNLTERIGNICKDYRICGCTPAFGGRFGYY